MEAASNGQLEAAKILLGKGSHLEATNRVISLLSTAQTFNQFILEYFWLRSMATLLSF